MTRLSETYKTPLSAILSQSNGTSTTKPWWRIRPANLEDAAQLASLMAEVWTINEAWSVPAGEVEKFMQEEYSTEAVRKSIEQEHMRTLVAVAVATPSDTGHTEDGEKAGQDTILGIAQSMVHRPDPRVSFSDPMKLCRLYVDFAYHGSGVAQGLFDETLELARREKAGGIWLGTWTQSHRAVRFYEKNGFEKIGKDRFKVGDVYQEDWAMERGLEL